MKNPKFEIRRSERNKLYFVLMAKNGEIILTSEEYERRRSVYVGIDSVIQNSPNPDMYQLFVGEDGQYYFNLRAKNNKVIGVSEGYRWKLSRWIGVRSVRKNAPISPISDVS
jgi:uncharacterized protein YegP (UPF0339 family)